MIAKPMWQGRMTTASVDRSDMLAGGVELAWFLAEVVTESGSTRRWLGSG